MNPGVMVAGINCKWMAISMSERPERPVMGRALESLTKGIDQDFSQPPSELPHAVRRRLQTALESHELFLDCAELLLSQLVHDPEARFLFLDPQSRYTLQMFTWPVGFGNQPHFHGNWNVSAVMAGSLLVFRSAISPADCLAAEPLLATCGQVGVLIPPQFHCLRNVGDEVAITFHVFSIAEDDHEKLHLEKLPVSDDLRIDDEGILAIARVAATYHEARSIDIIRTAFSLAGHATELELVKLMVMLNPREAMAMGRRLADLVGGRDRYRLLNLIEKMELGAKAV
jgi:hypothetical protein